MNIPFVENFHLDNFTMLLLELVLEDGSKKVGSLFWDDFSLIFCSLPQLPLQGVKEQARNRIDLLLGIHKPESQRHQPKSHNRHYI